MAAAGGSGTATVPLAGFPGATMTTTSSRSQVFGGNSAFLGASTPFGAAYGSSQGKQYLQLGAAPGGSPSTTTVTFASTPPVGWGFALGDVDADSARVTATTADGSRLTVDQLGWQSAFNYCRNSPRPTGCTGSGPFDDVPTWNPGTATLIGNVANTVGASGWFRPTVPVKSLTLTFSVQAGIPSLQVWIADLPVAISGSIKTNCGHAAPAGSVRLLHTDGSPVRDTHGSPVTGTTAHSKFSFSDVTAGQYVVVADSVAGYGGARRPVDAAHDVSAVSLTLTCPPPPTTTDEPAPEATPPVTVDVQPGESTTITLPDGQVATHVDRPAHGTAVVNPSGTITYMPDAGFSGTDRFHYTAHTRSGATVTGVIVVRVVLAATGSDVLPFVTLGGFLVIIGGGALGLRRVLSRR